MSFGYIKPVSIVKVLDPPKATTSDVFTEQFHQTCRENVNPVQLKLWQSTDSKAGFEVFFL